MLRRMTLTSRDYLFKDKVYWAARVNVHKVNIGVVVNELCTSCHGVGEAALHLKMKIATIFRFRFRIRAIQF